MNNSFSNKAIVNKLRQDGYEIEDMLTFTDDLEKFDIFLLKFKMNGFHAYCKTHISPHCNTYFEISKSIEDFSLDYAQSFRPGRDNVDFFLNQLIFKFSFEEDKNLTVNDEIFELSKEAFLFFADTNDFMCNLPYINTSDKFFKSEAVSL